MIIDSSQSNIEVIGDIKEFKTSIDPKNLEFITTLLSSNLYSDPEQSFIREIVSNAWDSHVEAGTTDTPVIIKFNTKNYDKSITIRDYGTGLSPERFAEVYCNIGSSTKRDSNDFIGGFGIGKYSSLACSNTVYITSYYNNIAYYYVMIKSGNSITTNLLKEQPTTEKNGVEITIRNILNLAPYEKALDYIVFFPNVYIDGICHYLNDVKLKRLTHIAISSRIIYYNKFLLGNVLYPYNSNLLPSDVSDFLSSIRNTGIVIKFEIGELGITPNRENIIYTSDTIDKISLRVREAKKELLGLIKKHLYKDYQNLEEYYKVFHKHWYYDPVSDSVNNKYIGYSILNTDILDMGITYKGIDLKDCLNVLSVAYTCVLPNYKAVVFDDKIYTTKLPNKLASWNYIKSKKILNCIQTPRLTTAIKSFLKEHYSNYAVTGDLNKSILESNLSSFIHELDPKKGHPHRDLIIDGIWESIASKMKTIDFKTDSDFLNYKESLATGKKPIVENNSSVILHELHPYYSYRYSKHFENLSKAVRHLKQLKGGIIIIGMNDDEEILKAIAKIRHYTIFKAKKEVINSIKALNLSSIIDTEWLLEKDPFINKVFTFYTYFKEGIYSNIKSLSYTIDKELCKEFAELLQCNSLEYCYIQHCKNIGTIDSYTKYLCEKLKFYLEEEEKAKEVIGDSYALHNLLKAAYIMKSRSYKINRDAYNDIKNNKLFKVLLCKK